MITTCHPLPPEQQAKGNSMRMLVRDVKTGMFYGADGQWTDERSNARDFGGTYQAMNFAKLNRLQAVQVVLAFEMPEYDVTINFEQGH